MTTDRFNFLLRGATASLLTCGVLLAGCGDDEPTATQDASTDAPATDLGTTDVQTADVPRDVQATDVQATDVPRDVPSIDAGVDVPATDAAADVPDGAVPAALIPPAGQSELTRVSARGTQIYTCTSATTDGGVSDGGAPFQWVFTRPEATLYDAAGNLFGTHFRGPNWRAVDGSQITGAAQANVAAPIAGAIPWLLLRVTETTGTGILSRVSSIQRINTSGGVAPGVACNASNVGAETGVPYTADYVFWAPTSDAAAPTAPLPAALNVPETGLSVLLRAAATGSQIYRCNATTPDGGTDAGAPYQWTFVAPEANLTDSIGTMIGTHFMGPTWRTTADNSQVVGMAAANVPAAGTIPWLLLRATSNMGTGPLGRARFVHRVATTGGAAPTTGCDAAAVGTEQRVSYTADYYFWGTP